MESKDRAAYLRDRIDYFYKKANEAAEIIERLRGWLTDAEIGYRDGVEEEIARWEDVAERLDRSADIARRKLAELEED